MYLDPGSGSVLIQLIIGAVFAIGISIRLFGSKIKKLFQKDTEDDTVDDDRQ